MDSYHAEAYPSAYYSPEGYQGFDDYYAPQLSNIDPVAVHDFAERHTYALPAPPRPYRPFHGYCGPYIPGQQVFDSYESRGTGQYDYDNDTGVYIPESTRSARPRYRQGSPSSSTVSSSNSGQAYHNNSQRSSDPYFSDGESCFTDLTRSASSLFIGSSPRQSFNAQHNEVTWSLPCISPQDMHLHFANHRDEPIMTYEESEELHPAHIHFHREPAFEDIDEGKENVHQHLRSQFEQINDPDRGSTSAASDDGADSDYSPGRRNGKRSRIARSPTDRALNIKSKSRITKRTSKVHTEAQSRSSKKSDTQPTSCSSLPNGNKKDDSDDRYFTCPLQPYGCDLSFAHKNEWKRHFNSQHLRLGYWRCDQCEDPDTRPNVFNRKDLFTQHLRRMHSGFPSGEYIFNGTKLSYGNPLSAKRKSSTKSAKVKDGARPSDAQIEAFESSLPAVRTRCWREVRQPPSKLFCIFCEKDFTVKDGVCDEWLEHVGRHLQSEVKSASLVRKGKADVDNHVPGTPDWSADGVLREWLLNESLIRKDPHTGKLAMPDKKVISNGSGVDKNSLNEDGQVDAEGDLE